MLGWSSTSLVWLLMSLLEIADEPHKTADDGIQEFAGVASGDRSQFIWKFSGLEYTGQNIWISARLLSRITTRTYTELYVFMRSFLSTEDHGWFTPLICSWSPRLWRRHQILRSGSRKIPRKYLNERVTPLESHHKKQCTKIQDNFAQNRGEKKSDTAIITGECHDWHNWHEYIRISRDQEIEAILPGVCIFFKTDIGHHRSADKHFIISRNHNLPPSLSILCLGESDFLSG